MTNPSDERRRRAHEYATSRGTYLKHSLGYGKDGAVFATGRATALKAFDAANKYGWERDCYLRLRECGVREVLGHHVPRVLAADDTFQVIEMTIVTPPYLLDFAHARLDYMPDFPPEVMDQWEQDRIEEFGPRWPRVRLIIDYMADQFGIYLTEIPPRNIAFE